MVDTSPPKSQLRGAKYFRKGGHYYADGEWACEKCPYAEDKTCANCMYARWNVDGIMAGFKPSEAHERAHPEEIRDAIRGSPLIQKIGIDAIEDKRHRILHTEVGPPGSGLTVDKYIDLITKSAQSILDANGFGGIRVTGDKVKQIIGRSPIELGSPQAQVLPMVPTGIPALPHGKFDPQLGGAVASPGDVNHSLASLIDTRRVLDHR